MDSKIRKIKKVRLNDLEAKAIFQKMALEHCENFSEFMRNCALNRKHKVTQKDVNAIALISQIKYIGNNLNQIAQALNTIKKSADKSQFTFEFIEKNLATCVEFMEEIKKEIN